MASSGLILLKSNPGKRRSTNGAGPGIVKMHTRLTCEQKFIAASFAKPKRGKKSLFCMGFTTVWNEDRSDGSQQRNELVFTEPERSGKVAQQTGMVALQPDNLSSNPGTHMVGETDS